MKRDGIRINMAYYVLSQEGHTIRSEFNGMQSSWTSETPGRQPTGLCSYALRSTAVGNAMHSNYCLLSSTINTPTHRSKSKSMLYFLAADFFLGAAFLAGDFFGAAFLAGDFLAAFGLEAFLAMAFLGAALALALDAFLGAMIMLVCLDGKRRL